MDGGANSQLAQTINTLIAKLPEEARANIIQTATQTGSKFVSNQITGISNTISNQSA